MEPINFRLDGKIALITGSGRGIGLGIATAIAAAGGAVVIQDIDLDVARQEADAINAAGGRAVALGGDITDLAMVSQLVAQTVGALGGLHILINNAAIQKHQHWLEETPEHLRRTFDADLIAPILLCQQVAPIFKAQKFGRIINIGSIQQRGANPTMLPYSLSKMALVGLTKALARDMARDGVTANLIAPGWFNTFRNRGDFKDEQDMIEKGRHVPVGRVGQPRDCAGVAVMLCSEAGDYVTGQSIFVDGGMSAR